MIQMFVVEYIEEQSLISLKVTKRYFTSFGFVIINDLSDVHFLLQLSSHKTVQCVIELTFSP